MSRHVHADRENGLLMRSAHHRHELEQLADRHARSRSFRRRAAALALGVLALLGALLAAGCSCALPHEHVGVLANDAEGFVKLWRIQYRDGLTLRQVERQAEMASRIEERAKLVRRGLVVEGKPAPDGGDQEEPR